ncbi:MAG: RNA 2',3'-cyclic phosphodiesterase [Longimicrobiales bacterium]
MRLFIALNFTKKEKMKLHRTTEVFRECQFPVKWVEPQSYHVTLKFLGKVSEERLEMVEEALDHVGNTTKSLEIVIESFGAFPTIRRPEVIWAGLEPSSALRCLKQDLEWALKDCGFKPETRNFHPHITLGRADSSKGAGAFRGLDEKAAATVYGSRVQIRKVDLMRTRQLKSDLIYTVEYSAALSG